MDWICPSREAWRDTYKLSKWIRHSSSKRSHWLTSSWNCSWKCNPCAVSKGPCSSRKAWWPCLCCIAWGLRVGWNGSFGQRALDVRFVPKSWCIQDHVKWRLIRCLGAVEREQQKNSKYSWHCSALHEDIRGARWNAKKSFVSNCRNMSCLESKDRASIWTKAKWRATEASLDQLLFFTSVYFEDLE